MLGLVGLPSFALQRPRVILTATYGSSGDASSHNVALPVSIIGNRLVLFVTIGANATLSTPSGWTLAFSGVTADTSNTGRRLYVFHKVADGTEGTSLTVTRSSSGGLSSIAYRIRGVGNLFANSPANGVSSAPNAADCAPGVGARDMLFISAYGGRAGSNTGIPSGYENGQSALGGSNILTATAERTIRAANDDAGAFTMSASDNWVAGTICLYA